MYLFTGREMLLWQRSSLKIQNSKDVCLQVESLLFAISCFLRDVGMTGIPEDEITVFFGLSTVLKKRKKKKITGTFARGP